MSFLMSVKSRSAEKRNSIGDCGVGLEDASAFGVPAFELGMVGGVTNEDPCASLPSAIVRPDAEDSEVVVRLTVARNATRKIETGAFRQRAR